MRLAVLLGILVGGLAAIQFLIGATPVELSPSGHGTPSARGYLLRQTGSATARLTLFGVSSRRLGPLYLEPVTQATSVRPIHAPAEVWPSMRSPETLMIKMLVPAGTYKLELPGVDPFGLVSVNR